MTGRSQSNDAKHIVQGPRDRVNFHADTDRHRAQEEAAVSTLLSSRPVRCVISASRSWLSAMNEAVALSVWGLTHASVSVGCCRHRSQTVKSCVLAEAEEELDPG